jgi:hypothetical protein
MGPEEIVSLLIESDGPVNIIALIEASVHKPARGKVYVASYTSAKGGQEWRTTGLTDREAAMALAKEWEAREKMKRAARPAPPPRPRMRVGWREQEHGLLTQKEVAAIMHISERSVRVIERRAFEKIRRHAALKEFWREWQAGEMKEAALPVTEWALTRAEIAAVWALAKTPEERQVLRKVLALTQGARPGAS